MSINIVDATPEDLKVFKEKMDAVLAELSLTLSLSINKIAISSKLEDGTIQTGFIDQPTLLIQKRVEVEDKVVEPEIISPIQQKDINEPN